MINNIRSAYYSQTNAYTSHHPCMHTNHWGNRHSIATSLKPKSRRNDHDRQWKKLRILSHVILPFIWYIESNTYTYTSTKHRHKTARMELSSEWNELHSTRTCYCALQNLLFRCFHHYSFVVIVNSFSGFFLNVVLSCRNCNHCQFASSATAIQLQRSHTHRDQRLSCIYRLPIFPFTSLTNRPPYYA